MEASELRLGNYFLLPNGEIARISYHEIRLLVISTEKPNYHPIPLTEELLLKCGFEKIGSNFELDWLIIHTHIQTGEFHFLLNEPHSRKYRVTKLIYLHQLQNLYFALTGQELTIKHN